MPKRLLRSVIEFDKEIASENLVRNYQRLRKAVDAGQLTWRPEDERLYKYISSYFLQYFEMPSAQTVLNYFTSVNGVETIERIKDIQVERPYARTNFVHLLRSLVEDQAKIKVLALLKETHEVLTKGVETKEGELRKGVEEAIGTFMRKAQEIRIEDSVTRIHGDIRTDGNEMREEYNLSESDKSRSLGVLSGIGPIDDSCKGAKKGELWIHAAFPGELKTMLANNWSYNAMTRYKTHVVYITFEMPYAQIRRNIITIHSSNARFGMQGLTPLAYEDIRDGNLSASEKEFYFNKVIPDFETNPTYGHFEVVSPDREWNIDDIRAQIELLHKEFEVGMVILDHGQWIEPRKVRKNKDYTIELNSVITDAKRLALQFDHNAGVPVVMLFQINRTGKTEADKNDGVYKMNALTYANNAEKTADIITTTYLNEELRKAGQVKICNLKNRDNKPFEPFVAGVDFPHRRIMAVKNMEPTGFSVEEHDAHLNSLMSSV